MNANMKVSEQCRIAASKGNQVLGMIRRNITYKEKRLITPLYKVIVRPHLEYCIQAWSPYLRKYIDMLEKIQRRATKLIPGLQPNRDFCFNLAREYPQWVFADYASQDLPHQESK